MPVGNPNAPPLHSKPVLWRVALPRVFWAAAQSHLEREEGSWSYKGTSRTWDCGELGWHVGRYGFPGI